jgi:hypothetical protein
MLLLISHGTHLYKCMLQLNWCCVNIRMCYSGKRVTSSSLTNWQLITKPHLRHLLYWQWRCFLNVIHFYTALLLQFLVMHYLMAKNITQLHWHIITIIAAPASVVDIAARTTPMNSTTTATTLSAGSVRCVDVGISFTTHATAIAAPVRVHF